MTDPAGSHYAVLGVATSVDAHELKRAYRRMQRSSHPDTGGSADHFRIVQEAWAVLGHPDRRAEYDRRLLGTSTRPNVPQHPEPPAARTAPPKGQEPRAPERPRVRRADSHGHPGGSARLKYLDLLRAWLVDPTPPARPVRRAAVKKRRGIYVRQWARLCARMTWTFAAGGAGVALLVAWWTGLLDADLAGVWRPIAVVGGFAAVAGALSSAPIAIIRMLRDPFRRELARFLREKAIQDATEEANYRSGLKDFEAHLRSRPANAEALLAAPYSHEAVRAASPGVRAWLDKAMAQEYTARALATLGPDFSVWHDLEVGAGNARIDHLLVGPQGLILIESLAAGESISVEFDALVRGGRPLPEVLDSLRPRMVTVGRVLGIPGVSATVIVYPDSALVDGRLQRLGGTPVPTFVVGASLLAEVLAHGLPGVVEGASWQLKNLREGVAQRVRFAQ